MPALPKPISIDSLAARIAAVEASGKPWRAGDPAQPVEAAWGPIARRTLHEWFAEAPPQTVLIDLTHRALSSHALGGGVAFWIGRVCWPYAAALGEAERDRSVFVDVPARDRAARVWAIDLVLRSPACAAVVADGRGLEMAQSRRLQLAAEAGGALALLWRRPLEAHELSVAHYRWGVSSVATDTQRPRWRIEMLRCKDSAARRDAGKRNVFLVEHRGAQGLVSLPADMVDRPHPAQVEPAALQRTA